MKFTSSRYMRILQCERLILSFVLMVLVVAVPPSSLIVSVAQAEETSPIRYTTQNADDRVVYSVDGRQMIYTIDSPRGIGAITFERVSNAWQVNQESHSQVEDKLPEIRRVPLVARDLVVRLRLKGLERFEVNAKNDPASLKDTSAGTEPGNAQYRVDGSISSHDGSIRQWKDGSEKLILKSSSPHWIDVRIIDTAGNIAAKVPLTDGYFELHLPKQVHYGNSNSITLSWIDFYR